MNNFVNRKSELAQLQSLHNRAGADLAVVYGRRRLGKTALLREFSKDKPHCYYMASRAGEKLQINAMGKALATMLREPILENIDFTQWDELFELLDKCLPESGKFIFIIDEFQYLCQVQPAFSSILQKWWDEKWSNRNILLILCGSITSMMYRETLAESAPLYGRASLQLLISPVRYEHLPEFLPVITTQQELVEFYSMCGGVPRYMELMRDFKNFYDALNALLLDKNGILHNEAKFILHEEITSPNTCWSILHALANGYSKISKLGSCLALPANQLTRYIDLLKDLFLVYREVPVLEKNSAKSKKGIYHVSDPLMRLWFGAIYSYESFLEFGETDIIMDKIQPQIDNHAAYCFEDLCRQYVRNRMSEFSCIRVGRQWGKNYEIDVAGVNADNKLALLGECKWSDRKVGVSILKDLRDKVSDNKLPISSGCCYILFSKTGFTDDLIQLSVENSAIILVDSIL